jgi:hypothetical protein
MNFQTPSLTFKGQLIKIIVSDYKAEDNSVAVQQKSGAGHSR